MLAFLTRRADWLVIFGILATAGGCLAGYYLPSTWRKADAIAQEPQSVSVQELAVRPSVGMRHVIVTDFACGRGYAFELHTRKGDPTPTPDQTGFGKAWIPLFPKLPADNPDVGAGPKRFAVFLETSSTMASGTGFHLLSRKPSIEGLAMPTSQRPLRLCPVNRQRVPVPGGNVGSWRVARWRRS